ncbi:DUF221-domain-containing protein [Piedraia hortae CBS 480.64]|uniref:DUF221-domain-containing protein n=1 Tax=Piedraia hortae CBS 480.64 TaxID=1314780 RepID=A0A6A7BP40_9PEZI|nr:DUF221-domain-containing protein [Piedraia hortae CBS 480.64]
MASPTLEFAAASVLKRDSSQSDSPQSTSSSASSLVSTLVPVLAVGLVWTLAFLILRRKFKRNYEPRTFVDSLRPEQRSPKLSDSLFGWISQFRGLSDYYVLQHHSLDAYLFLRFLRLTVILSFVGCLITWPVLFPVNATGGAGKKQLDILTMANVKNTWRYWAHAGCAIIFFSVVLYAITRESIYYINLRQAYLMSPFSASRISSRTVLFTSVPAEYMDETKLRAMLGSSVRRMWFVTDTKKLEELVKERDKAAMRLEGAETKLIKTANANRLKGSKASPGSDEAAVGDGSTAMRFLTQKKRPTHRLKPLIGKKVDTIEWCRSELQRLIPEVNQMQAAEINGQGKRLNAVFVEFTTMIDAQEAYQSLAHHQPLHMAPRYAGVLPEEVIWPNLRIKWWQLILRKIATTAFICALIIFWAIPVAAVGSISNIDNLENSKAFHWLHYIFDPMPKAIMGVVTGLLPVVLLSILMSLVPIICRFAAKLGGAPTKPAIELWTQNSFFAFQVIQVFLVATIGSAASSVGAQIAKNPSSAINLLSNNLPRASNFYLSYFVLQGIGAATSGLAAVVGLVVFFVLGRILDNTPRKMYTRWISLAGLGWGSMYPVYTNLFVIAICYAGVAPLVLGFACIGLFLFYIYFRYSIMYVSNTDIDCKGRPYPRALQHLFVGLYLAEVCLIGLFAIASGSGPGAVGPLVLMIIFLIFTVLYHISLNRALRPLLEYLPKSINAEERRMFNLEQQNSDKAMMNKESGLATTGKKPGLIQKFFKPHVHDDYAHLRQLVPQEDPLQYSQEDEELAYCDPAISSKTPLLWIPRDPVGMSQHEIRSTQQVIPITDEGAYLSDKNKLVWDAQDDKPPVYEYKPYY